MWSDLIKVLDIGTQDTMQLLLLQDEQVIQTLATHTAQKPFTDGIGAWRMNGRLEYLDAAGGGLCWLLETSVLEKPDKTRNLPGCTGYLAHPFKKWTWPPRSHFFLGMELHRMTRRGTAMGHGG